MYLFLFSVVVVLVHAVQHNVLSKTSRKPSDWISAISHLLIIQHNIAQVVHTIGTEVALIVEEIEGRKLIRRWMFSPYDATIFARKLNQCVNDNLI